MNKKEFLKLLESKLQVLEEKEIKDILEEYENHIEEKVKEGKTEEKAIEDFGDLDELVDEILSAYKINTKKVRRESKTENFFNTLLDEMVKFGKRVVKTFEGKKGDDLIRLICKFILILILISILRFPFEIIKDLGVGIFEELPWFLDSIITGMWVLVVELIYFMIAILAIYVTIKSIILDEEVTIDYDKIKQAAGDFEEEITKKKTGKNVNNKKTESKVIYKDDIDPKDGIIYNEQDTKPSKIILEPISLLLKIFVMFITLPAVFALFGLITAFGVMIALACQGIYLVSLFFIVIGLIMIIYSVISIIYHILFSKGGKC